MDSPDVELLPDPHPFGAPAGQWWPPVAMDPNWIREHAGTADVLHIHFGTESFSTEHLSACLAAAREIGWPVVFTVHDLVHPQLDDQAAYLAQLDVLIPRADALVTLTDGAAAEILERWGRSALVSPHPALLPATAPYPRAHVSAEAHIGMHLKDLRGNIDAVGMTRALGQAMDSLAVSGVSAQAEIRMHHRVRNNDLRDEIRCLVREYDRTVLIEHDRLDDAKLWNALARLDVCMLPYSHGTHSGWLELCWDLAVPVVAPPVGFYENQHVDGSVVTFTAGADGRSLASAITTALRAPTATRAGSAERNGEMDRRRAVRTVQAGNIATMHADLYRQLLSGVRS